MLFPFTVGWLKTWARRMWLRAARCVACLADVLLQASCQRRVYARCLWGKARGGWLKLGLRMNVVHLDAYPGAVHRRSAPLHRVRANAFRVDWAASGRRRVYIQRIQRRGLRCIVVHGSNPVGVLTRYTGDTLAFSPSLIVDEAQVLREVK